MPLHPAAAKMLEDMAASERPNAHLLPVAVARQNYESDFGLLERPEVETVVDVMIPVAGTEIRGRVYTPTGGDVVRPMIVFFHGGGWLLGSLDSHDMMARKISLATDCVVLSVDYRRGPESRFPTATDDAFDSVKWAAENAGRFGADGSRLVVAGDSAGGNLATVVAVRCRDEAGPRIAHQLLIYPVTTCDLDIGFDMEFEGVMLYRDEMLWHQENYLSAPEDRTNPLVAPLLADLTDLPPATVVLAECDPIRPQGQMYADALAAANVPVTQAQFPGMIHGFFGLEMLFHGAEEATMFIGDSVQRAMTVHT